MRLWGIRISVIQKMISYVSQYKIQWLLLFLLKLGQKLPILLQPLLFGFFIDHVISTRDVRAFFMVVGMVLGLYMLESFLKIGHRMIDNDLFNRITGKLRREIWKRYMDMSADLFNRYKISDLVERLNQDVDMVKFFLVGEVFDYIATFFSMVVSGILIFSLEWHIALTICFFCPISFFLAGRYHEQLEKLAEEERQQEDRMGEMVQNVPIFWKEVKANRLEEKEEAVFTDVSKNILACRWKKENCLFRRNLLLSVKGSLIDSLALFAAGGVVSLLFGTQAGIIVACVNYYQNILADIHELMEMDAGLEWIRPSIDRVTELLQFQFKKPVYENESGKSGYEYDIKNISYRYEQQERKVLDGFGLKIERGEKILLEGPSGSGKSTLMKLLAKELEYREGEILFRGRSLNKISEEEYYRLVRKVDNSTYYMNVSVREFMRLADPDASDERILQALSQVKLWKDTAEREVWVNEKIGENGARLSGGQRQRLALARLFLVSDKILLLDEAFSAIDVIDKRHILDNLLEHYKDGTVICISHEEGKDYEKHGSENRSFTKIARIHPAGAR